MIPQIVRMLVKARLSMGANLFGVTRLPPTDELVTVIMKFPELLICLTSPLYVAKIVW